MSKFCTVCGNPCLETAKFCTVCGSRLIPNVEESLQKESEITEELEEVSVSEAAEDVMEEAKQTEQEAEETVREAAEKITSDGPEEAAAKSVVPEKPKKEKKGISKKLLIPIIAAAAAAVIIIVVLVNVLGKTIDLSKYVDINIQGPSGYATASADVNEEELTTAVFKALGRKVDNVSDIYNNFDLGIITDAGKVDTVLRGMNIELDKTENISNGDEITATVTYTGQDAKELGLRIKEGSTKLKAADLPDPVLLDPFEKLNVTFTGVDGYGDMELDSDEDDIWFYADDYDYGSLSNGDQVKVIAEYNEYSLLEKNIVVTATEKTYTVSGLQEVQEVDLFSAITLTFEGVDHYGSAVMEDSGEYDDYYVWFYLDKDYDLSNGDTVTVTADFDEDYLAQKGIAAQASEKTYTVEGLKESEEIDIFKDVEIQYDGIAPFAYAWVDSFYDDNNVYYYFELDKDENLAIGDKITVTADFDEEDLAKAGYAAASNTKEYTVEGIDAYITEVKDMTDEDLKTIQKLCTDFLDEQYKDSGSSTITHSGETYVGCYIMTGDPEAGYNGNIIVPVFQGKVSDSSSDYKLAETSVYYAFMVTEVYHKADGTLVYDDSVQFFTDDSGPMTSIGTLSAFTDGKQMYDAVITANKDIVTYVMTDTLKQFGE